MIDLQAIEEREKAATGSMHSMRNADWQFHNNAHADIRALIAEVRRLEKILNTASWMPDWKVLEKQNVELMKELKRYRELAKVVRETLNKPVVAEARIHCALELLKEVHDA